MNDSWDAPPDPLEALQGGDRGPFEAFVSQAAGDLLGFFRRLGARRPDAEDLIQDVFLKMVRNSSHYRPQGRFRAYVLRTARNAWVDRARRAGVRPRLVAPSEGLESEGHEGAGRLAEMAIAPAEGSDALEMREQQQRIEDALAELGDNHRQVFELGVVRELPYAEIADMLGVPVGTVKSRMFHAVRKLREALEPEEDRGELAKSAKETQQGDRR